MSWIHSEHYLILKIPTQVTVPFDWIKLICLLPVPSQFFLSGRATAWRLSNVLGLNPGSLSGSADTAGSGREWLWVAVSSRESGDTAQNEAEEVGRGQTERNEPLRQGGGRVGLGAGYWVARSNPSIAWTDQPTSLLYQAPESLQVPMKEWGSFTKPEEEALRIFTCESAKSEQYFVLKDFEETKSKPALQWSLSE